MNKINRPEGFKDECRDCTVVALSLAGNVPYEKVHLAFMHAGRKDGHGIHTPPIIRKVCKELGLKALYAKKKGTINTFIKQRPKGKFFCLRRGHAFAVIDGIVHGESNTDCHLKIAWAIKPI